MKTNKKFLTEIIEPVDLSNKTAETHHTLHIPHKSQASDNYSEWDDLIFMQSSSENIKLKYKLEKALKENRELSQKISKITDKYSSEIQKRDELIISLTNLMKEREEKYKKVLNDHSEETKNQIFIKENEIFYLKNSLKHLKHQLQQTKAINSTFDLNIEIENLRKLLEFAEKENKDLKTENKTLLSKEKVEKMIEFDL